MRSLRFVLIVLGSLALFSLTACLSPMQVRITGGGNIPSQLYFNSPGGGTSKANFTVSGNNCGEYPDESNPYVFPFHGKLSFNDKYATGWGIGGVKFDATITNFANCGPILANDEDAFESTVCSQCMELMALYGTVPLAATFDYVSTNKSLPGSGSGIFCYEPSVTKGPGQSSVAVVEIDDGGIYSGYSNGGVVQGNINVINCPAPQTYYP